MTILFVKLNFETFTTIIICVIKIKTISGIIQVEQGGNGLVYRANEKAQSCEDI